MVCSVSSELVTPEEVDRILYVVSSATCLMVSGLSWVVKSGREVTSLMERIVPSALKEVVVGLK